ncbi:hypothetical protein Nepgr_019574 [Nepenthes gracilis]|uniref:Uncharacterized protein n=1 Tax=Nepenthes gracilis TaxID=150966 RepID=A0AAD3STQ6_NEPGR|nr:hypothetical protein Nepgr_019574 [Nepenthes gracilis]
MDSLNLASDRLPYVESGAVRSELHFEACDCWLSLLKVGHGPVLKVTPGVGGCAACDDANRLNAGSILFEHLFLFRLADGKQLGFVGELAEWLYLALWLCVSEYPGWSLCAAEGVVLLIQAGAWMF